MLDKHSRPELPTKAPTPASSKPCNLQRERPDVTLVATDERTDVQILSLPTDTSAALDNVTTSYGLLRTEVDECQYGFLLAPALDEYDLQSFTTSVQSSMDDLNEEDLDELATDVSRFAFWEC